MASHSYWPTQIIQAFTVRMAGHGFSVSGTMMNHDKRYALEQLRHAHTMADDRLRELAVELFRYFEEISAAAREPAPAPLRSRRVCDPAPALRPAS